MVTVDQLGSGTQGSQGGGAPEHPAPAEKRFDFSGGELCLDFCNTLNGSRARPKELLLAYPDLVSWARQAGIVGDFEARALVERAYQNPTESAEALFHAKALREAIFRLFSNSIDDAAPEPADLAILNVTLGRALSHRRLSSTHQGFAWEWQRDDEAFDTMLWPVVQSAADLLVSPKASRVRRCGGTDCDWLFMDMSRNQSRRWCDMSGCGNRAKARRYYARKKTGR
jgi:predicted RNA-binding Zn ribbon-like protein